MRHLPRAPPARRRRVCSALRGIFSAPFLSAEGEDCPAFCGRFAAVCETAKNGLFRASETLQSGQDGSIGALLACDGQNCLGQSARKGQSGRNRTVKQLFVRYAGLAAFPQCFNQLSSPNLKTAPLVYAATGSSWQLSNCSTWRAWTSIAAVTPDGPRRTALSSPGPLWPRRHGA